MSFRFLLILLLLGATPLHADSRPWMSRDGKRSVQGSFLARDEAKVTIRRGNNRKIVEIPLAQLHADDLAWLESNHPLTAPRPDEKALVFDTLRFGDSRDEVLAKLKASELVELTVNEVFLARTGLNGVFRTRQKIGGLGASLSFGWSSNNQLDEIILQTDALPPATQDSQLEACWKEFIGLLTTLHGKPVHANNHFDLAPIEDGAMSGTHVWKLEETGSAMLGPARESDKFQVVVRFTKEDIKPVIIPGSAPVNQLNP